MNTKFMRIRVEAIDGQHAEIWLLDSDGIDGTEFRTERLVSAGRRRIALSNEVAHTNSRESESRRSTGSIPKFGDWVRTGLTARNFGKNN